MSNIFLGSGCFSPEIARLQRSALKWEKNQPFKMIKKEHEVIASQKETEQRNFSKINLKKGDILMLST